ncbi:PAS domain-containing sensor histidine kinase [Candidatus Saccharibacteria bacterium]|nr:PAS domain-containing sensor histidine kinase [Candidatus Saccharibacteria bacterium]
MTNKRPKEQNYNADLLRVIWYTGFATIMIYPVFSLLSWLLPGQHIFSVGTIFIGGIDLSPLTVAIYVALGVSVFILKPRTQKQISVLMIVYLFANILFSWLIVNENIISQIIWILYMFMAYVLFGWKWFTIGAVAMIVSEAGNLFYTNADADAIVLVLVSTASMILFAFYISFLRAIGMMKIEIYEKIKTREETQAANLTTVVNSIDDAILNIGMRGKILMYNAASLGLFDTNANLVGMNIDNILNLVNENGDSLKFKDLIKGINNATVERTDLMHMYSDGQKISLYIAISPVHRTFGRDDTTQSVSGVIMIMRDITKQKTLDDERDEFISVVSHELRTPVAVVEGTVSNLQFLLEKGNDPKLLSKSLDDAHQQVTLLSSMLNDLSTLSRAQRGVNMDSENINVGELIDELYHKYLPESEKRKLTLEKSITVDGQIYIARMLIEEVMQNLISNALKYTSEGKVVIGTRPPAPGDADHVEFYVKDSGIGISQSDQKHVFQKFWRSEDYRTRETNGTGLGLHVVSQLADKMNTKVEFVSRLNHGSTFSFALPLIKVDEE